MHDIENCCSSLYIWLWWFKYTKKTAVFFLFTRSLLIYHSKCRMSLFKHFGQLLFANDFTWSASTSIFKTVICKNCKICKIQPVSHASHVRRKFSTWWKNHANGRRGKRGWQARHVAADASPPSVYGLFTITAAIYVLRVGTDLCVSPTAHTASPRTEFRMILPQTAFSGHIGLSLRVS